jgi:hypothetical protein
MAKAEHTNTNSYHGHYLTDTTSNSIVLMYNEVKTMQFHKWVDEISRGIYKGFLYIWKISPPPGFDPRTAQPVASPYTDWAIPAHDGKMYYSKLHTSIFDKYCVKELFLWRQKLLKTAI